MHAHSPIRLLLEGAIEDAEFVESRGSTHFHIGIHNACNVGWIGVLRLTNVLGG